MPRRSTKSPAAERDRERTEARILDAVGGLLARDGFEGLGVNAIAHEAGIDKVLLYRYFGGLSGLLSAYAERGDHWPKPEEIRPAASSGGGEDLAEGMVRFARALRRRPETLEILRWELGSRNELVDAIAAVRERRGRELLGHIELPRGTDVPAVVSVLSAGLTYLLLRGKTADLYNGIDLHTEEGWARIEEAARTIVRAVASAPPAPEPQTARMSPGAKSARPANKKQS